MKRTNIIRGLLVVFIACITFACDEGGDPDPGGTNVENMSGDWYVQEATDGVGSGDYFLISTYNTANNKGTEMWIDDNLNYWWFKAKCPVNSTSLTFSGNDLESSVEDDDDSTPNVIETYDITVTVTGGAIVKGGATAPSGTVVDSITFDIEFSDDPGTVYTLKGYKRTGFLEDEH